MKWTAFAMTTLMSAGLVLAADSTAVTPLRVTEHRVVPIGEEGEERMFGSGSALQVELKVTGPDADTATRYGKIKVSKATDDTGKDLTKSKIQWSNSDDFEEIDREQMQRMANFGRPNAKQAKVEGFDMRLDLPQASDRKATKIAEISGEFEMIVGGEQKVVEIKKIKSQIGKAIEDPALAAAGITIMILDPAKQQLGFGDNAVNLEMTGKSEAIERVEVVNAAGKNISHGSSTTTFNGKKTIGYQLSEPLTDEITLRYTLRVGQKTVKVPFALKDLPLP